jgi:hypothetical protein
MPEVQDPKPVKKIIKTNTGKGGYTPVSSPKPSVVSNSKPKTYTPSGVTPKLASKAVAANDGNVQGVWHAWAPGAIKDYMKQGMSFSEARSEAMGDFGYDIDPVAKGPKLWSGYTWTPDETPDTMTGVGGYQKKNYGGGGGGGYLPTPPTPPEMKIRTSTGQRRSPYWSSEDPYIGGFEPRFVVLGDSSNW